jgi:FkbM family methyltransferase
LSLYNYICTLKTRALLRKFINNNLPITRIKIGIAKILYSVVSVFYGKKSRLITRNNIKFEVDLSEGIDFSLFLFGNYQKHVTKSKLLQLPADATIIDIGANLGAMTLQFAQIASKGKVYSFEPALPTLVKLQRNLQLNPELASHVVVVNSFASSKSAQNPGIKAYSSWKLTGEKGVNVHPEHLGIALSTEGVGSVSLDDFSKSEQLNRIDFIKIDTDGHEFEVLNGAKNLIAKFRPRIIFEISQYIMKERGIDFSFYSNYFKEANYKMHDSASEAVITLDNYSDYIPKHGTIDIIALPL